MEAHLKSASKGAADEHTNLWETVLKQVGSSKSALAKNVLVLGDSNSGKSKVVAQLFQASLRPQVGNGLDTASSATAAVGTNALGGSGLASDVNMTEIDSVITLSKHDLALSYSYMDVRDEDNEETIARFGIYQLASDRVSDRELLRFVMDVRSFSASAAVIVLDWSKPWRFVKTLLRWMNVLTAAVDTVCSDTGGRESTSGKAGGWTRGRATVDECRERLEVFLQEYAEPADGSEDQPSALGAADASLGRSSIAANGADLLLPLDKGVLEANLGIPIIVVCTKSDAMDVMERERGFKEEDFDYIQQILRAICLRFGAALIYTSTHNPSTFATLYHYLVHRLLSVPHSETSKSSGNRANLDDDASKSGDVEMAYTDPSAQTEPSQQTQQQVSYPFRVRANVVDRSVVFVPSGWDSASKIGYLREPFDVLATQALWVADEQRYSEIVDRAIRESALTLDTASEQRDSAGSDSLLRVYGEVVAAPRRRGGADIDSGSAAVAAAAAAAGMASQVDVEDDQTFLERLYDEQQDQMALEGEDPEAQGMGNTDVYGDSRMRLGSSPSSRYTAGVFRGNQGTDSGASGLNDNDSNAGFSDDGMDDFDRSDSGNGASLATISRQSTMRSVSHARSESVDVPNGSIGRSSSARLGRKLTIPTADAAASGSASSATGAGGASNEELTSFFQNLLGRKGGVTPTTTTSSNGKNSPQQAAAARPLGGSMSRVAGAAATTTQKDVQADLERRKAQLKRPKD
ncbi:hypothetical protein GGI15_003794 [Coemansia interrupta]|uniref:Dynein light intermediate chain n=1 Tax=Coemansia interrupta TaxID=1126814 RepID=A0A9W8LH17_9FUNG|nr:hypothetical protein GGI15_003794 [Coemansia interrupta]